MTKIKKGNLSIDKVLVDFITDEAIPGTDTNIEDFWSKFDLAIHELAPINKKLIQKILYLAQNFLEKGMR